MAAKTRKYDYIVSIDLGTTYSGHSYADIQGHEIQQKLVEKWQFTRSHKRKELTTATYKENSKTCVNCDIFLQRKEKDVSKHTDSHLYCDHVGKFKLWLDRTMKDLTPLPNGLTPIEVISDYLKYLHMSAIDEIIQKGLKDLSRIRYCLTVPIIWSEESRSIMRRASIMAGIIEEKDDPDRLLIVDEPVVAAIYSQVISPEFYLDHGDKYMICDAGGGTVDLAIFEIEKTAEKSGLREITMGSGSLCGSAFLDTRFKSLVRKRLSGLTENQIITYSLTNDFSVQKVTFDNTKGMDILGFYNEESPKTGIKEVALSFSAYQICEEVFEPVVSQVIELIENQFVQLGRKRLDAMFVTGGFGQSPYLTNRIKETFKYRVGHFKFFSDGQLAVIRGALLYGINPQAITQRIIRRTYGIKLGQPIEAGITAKAGTSSPKKDEFYVFVDKGQPINEDLWIKKKIFWTKDSLPIISLYAYDKDPPVPKFPSHEDTNLVAIFDTKFEIDPRELSKRTIMVLRMRFGLDKIHIKVNICGREFDYLTVWDITGEKEKLSYNEINPQPLVKLRKFFLMDEIVKRLP